MVNNAVGKINPICVVVDTNIWRKTFLLRDSQGSALLYNINQCEGKLGIPEIIDLEIRSVLLRTGKKARNDINSNLGVINLIMGYHKTYNLPSEQELHAAIEGRIMELQNISHYVEITIEHTRSAIRRINTNLPPSYPGKEQFKDSLIWEAVLELAKEYNVHFVTSDSGFFKDKDMLIIADELKNECKQLNLKVILYSKLEDCLQILQTVTPQVDKGNLEIVIYQAIKEKIASQSAKHNFDVLNIKLSEIKPFITQDHETLSISFKITFEGTDLSLDDHNPRNNIEITVSGTAMYSTNSNKISDVKIDHIFYQWTDDKGQKKFSKDAFVYVNIDIDSETSFKGTTCYPLD